MVGLFANYSQDMASWDICDIWLPHVLATLTHADDLDLASKATADLLNKTSLHLKRLAQFEMAKTYLQKALAIDEKVYGPDHPTVAIRVNNLGGVLKSLGDLQGAKKTLRAGA
jgi:hypothetical protein